MVRIEENTRNQRLERIYLLLSRNARGLTEAEIADELNLERRSTNNYLRDLEYAGKTFKDGIYWYPLTLKTSKLRPLDLSPEEAMALYLGARLLAKQHDQRNEPAETALLKLATVLKADAGVGDEIQQAAIELSKREVKHGYQDIFNQIVRGYIYRKKVSIEYQPLGWKKPFKTLFSTYLIEPSMIGFSTYVIGYSSIVNNLRTYKLERIRKAELTSEDYAIPSNFPGLDVLRNAWQIVGGDEIVQVTLRFSPKVRERVLETTWHPSQQTMEDKERKGWLRWEVQVANTLDLTPWIRSWGGQVEVLEPNELIEVFRNETKQLSRLYSPQPTQDILIARAREYDGKIQPLSEHLEKSAKIAGKLAGKIGLEDIGSVMGYFHDIGKASKKFQTYIRSACGLVLESDPDYMDFERMRGKIDHSSAGAQYLYRVFKNIGKEGKIAGEVFGLCLASHHSGLIDAISPEGDDVFKNRMEKNDEDTHLSEVLKTFDGVEKQMQQLDVSRISQRIFKALNACKKDTDSSDTLMFKHHLLIRFLYSCLIDADRINSADFEHPSNIHKRQYGDYEAWDVLIDRLERKYQTFFEKKDKNIVDDARNEVAASCLEFSKKPKGIYTLTVPTGGGKTLASLRFAFHHAARHEMDRIIYVIPYTSIIEQNAEEVRKIIENKDANGKNLNDVVLEHHSNFTPSDDENDHHKLLAQNWDAPVIFTTQVQFFEALFGSGTSRVRRMHQMAKAVIIFDEIQTLPIKCVHMFNVGLRFLIETCGSTAVLSTATQPLLDQVEPFSRAISISEAQKIIAQPAELFKKLERVEVSDRRRNGGWDDQAIADVVCEQAQEHGSVLIVVNTKRSAKNLYQCIKNRSDCGDGLYHLSTNMCPAHRLVTLNTIKEKLVKNEKLICVSTQLIEAGVDIDFGCVIRFTAGLDSIAQAAGRCNREGRRRKGNVIVINPEEEHIDRLTDIRIGKDITERVLGEFSANPENFDRNLFGPKMMERYFYYYFFNRKDAMCYRTGVNSPIGREDNLFDLLSSNKLSIDAFIRNQGRNPGVTFRQSFQSAAKYFHVIDAPTRGVIVSYGEGESIITELCGAFGLEKQYFLLRKAQQFSVNLYEHNMMELMQENKIHEIETIGGVYYLEDMYYHDDIGWSEEP